MTVQTPNGRLTREVTSEVICGRHPGTGGIVIGGDDPTISAQAVRVHVDDSGVWVENLSSRALIQVTGAGAVKSLEPLEGLRLVRNCAIIVPGTLSWTISIAGVPLPTRPPRPAHAGATRRALNRAAVPVPLRQAALVAMCLPRFDPRAWPHSGLLNAPAIAEQLALIGQSVTAKEVNNKLTRLRKSVGDELGITIENREELAGIAIANELVTMRDVDRFNAMKRQQDRNVMRAPRRRVQPRRDVPT